MFERAKENFNARVAGVIQQREAWIEHFINTRDSRKKKRTFFNHLYLLKLLMVPHL